MDTLVVLGEVLNERGRQDEKFGEQNHPDHGGPETVKLAVRQQFGEWAGAYRFYNDALNGCGQLDWTGILLEEVYEALAESDPERIREELIQVAAVAVAWIEAIDRREG